MILLCGIPTESPLAMVQHRLEQMGVAHRIVSQRACLTSAIEFEVGSSEEGELRRGEGARGLLQLDGEQIRLEECAGIYIRLIDDAVLPELEGEPAGAPRRLQARAWHETLAAWCEVTPHRVVNRMSAMGSNASKPFQAQTIMRFGFRTPETLITNDPAAVAAFRAQHGRVIYKSMSGVRSIVRELAEDDVRRLDQIRWCPVQFQAFVPGENVRVHVVGEDAFATRIESAATDYRYASEEVGDHATLSATTLSDELQEACVALARELILPFAGIDLKVTPEGEVYCFEVNPSPAYSYYECATGQEISTALARWLAG